MRSIVGVRLNFEKRFLDRLLPDQAKFPVLELFQLLLDDLCETDVIVHKNNGDGFVGFFRILACSFCSKGTSCFCELQWIQRRSRVAQRFEAGAARGVERLGCFSLGISLCCGDYGGQKGCAMANSPWISQGEFVWQRKTEF